MFFPKLITLAAVLAPAIAIVWLQHHSVARQQESNSRIRASITSIEEEIGVLDGSRTGVRPSASAGSLSAPTPFPPISNTFANASTGRSGSSGEIPYVTLSKTNLKHLELTPFSDEFKLTDEVSAVLGISSSERAAVNQALGRLIATQQQMDVSRLQIISDHLTTDEGRKTTFKVPAYAEEGRQLAGGLIAEVQGAIGPERTEILLGFADLNSLLAEGYEPFGRTEKIITFLDRENPDGTRGDCKIFMKIGDTVTGFSLSTSFVNRDDSIPKAWRHLIQNAVPTR